jgi:hypothetical protein
MWNWSKCQHYLKLQLAYPMCQTAQCVDVLSDSRVTAETCCTNVVPTCVYWQHGWRKKKSRNPRKPLSDAWRMTEVQLCSKYMQQDASVLKYESCFFLHMWESRSSRFKTPYSHVASWQRVEGTYFLQLHWRWLSRLNVPLCIVAYSNYSYFLPATQPAQS